jgi:2-desacetyl-2-hydroxyethyl bacteriochlorophyllide A dehydrogenase
MIAVHLESGEISVRQVDVPGRPAGFALLRMLCAGICNTDLELQRGYYSFRGIPGHEFVGEVVAADRTDLIGKRVVGEINLACGRCNFCAIGLGRHCPNRAVLGIVRHPGAFAEYLVLPESNLHVISDCIPTEQAVFVEPLAAACEILDQVQIPEGEPVAVLGDGKLGLLIAQVLHAHGAQVTLFGRNERKVEIARNAGIETSTSAQRPQSSFQFVIEATGSPVGLREAVGMARPRGTVVMKSTVHGEVAMDAASVIVNEISLIGSRCGRFEPAIEMLRSGRLRLGEMLSAEYPLDQAPAAFIEAARPSVLKVLLRNDQRERTS